LPVVTRSFTSFSKCAAEIAESRVCVGYHFRHAINAALAQGRQVGEQMMATQLARPVRSAGGVAAFARGCE
jgi:hypothetical protein